MKVLDAVKAANGKVVKNKAGQAVKVDAVSGATRYERQLYSNFDLLARNVVAQMEANPAWPKKGLTK